jgi:hypothetical protein
MGKSSRRPWSLEQSANSVRYDFRPVASGRPMLCMIFTKTGRGVVPGNSLDRRESGEYQCGNCWMAKARGEIA